MMRERRIGTSAQALIIAFELLICTVFSINLSAIQVEAAESAASFSGNASVAINNNVPEFTADEITTASYERYGDFDSLGRCTTAIACVGKAIMPTEERGSIGSVKPTGWDQNKYPGIVNSEPPYLYNRCHLIGYQLTGENANEKNLITGTRYFNIEGMLPYENRVAAYVESTGNHVMYRVTPIFSGNNLLCDGVKMEAYSVEDGGNGVSFNVFCYNVQPGVLINYADGSNQLDEGFNITSNETEQGLTKSSPAQTETAVEAQSEQADQPPQSASYIANKNTKKFHYPSCSSVSDMKEKNKLYYEGSRDDLINQGYVPCKRCNP